VFGVFFRPLTFKFNTAKLLLGAGSQEIYVPLQEQDNGYQVDIGWQVWVNASSNELLFKGPLPDSRAEHQETGILDQPFDSLIKFELAVSVSAKPISAIAKSNIRLVKGKIGPSKELTLDFISGGAIDCNIFFRYRNRTKREECGLVSRLATRLPVFIHIEAAYGSFLQQGLAGVAFEPFSWLDSPISPLELDPFLGPELNYDLSAVISGKLSPLQQDFENPCDAASFRQQPSSFSRQSTPFGIARR